MGLHWFHVPAAAGVVAHAYFASIETFGWGPERVKSIAPSWFDGLQVVACSYANSQIASTKEFAFSDHVAWAEALAFNIGVYNLMLAIGLGWTIWADPRIGRPLAGFFGIWALCAALAAYHTGVMPAVYVQGILGALLLSAAAIGRRSEIVTI